jgi:AhpC/TSA family
VSPRPGWMVALVALAALVYITLNTLRTEGVGSTGPSAGTRLPDFAAPLVLSDLDGDANVAIRPGQGAAGARPACSIRDPRALNVCALVRERPLVLAFLTEGADRCVAELDAMAAVAPRFPDVAFAAVAIRGDRDDLRKLVREHGWDFPVAQDRDGAVANIYGVAVCPTVVFAYRGGQVMESAIGEEVATQAKLVRRVRALAAGPPERR